ncbi:MAG TPA: hypothetical protein VM618_02685 [Acidimicrobiia bacterium]|nr:hypothetical protein [Acidimicrobiia bacterium]
MAVDEEMRYRVYEAMKAHHGSDVAGALMEMLPPAGVPELATKADLALHAAAVEHRIDALDNRLARRIDGLEGRIDGLEGRMDQRFQVFEAQIGERIERALRQQGNRYITWMVATAGLCLAAAGLASGLA